jgi:hypothetical protein
VSSGSKLVIVESPAKAKTIAKYDALLDARRKAIKSAPRGPPPATAAAIELNSIRPFSLTSKNTVYLG